MRLYLSLSFFFTSGYFKKVNSLDGRKSVVESENDHYEGGSSDPSSGKSSSSDSPS